MIKIFYKTLFSILIIILLIIFYLTIFGLETKKFNHLISNNLEKKHENLSIELNRVYLKLFPFDLSFILKTKNPIIIYKNKNIKIKSLTSQINISSILRGSSGIKKIKVDSGKLILKDIIDIMKLYKNNFQLVLASKFVKSGIVNLYLDINFDKNGNIKDDYKIEAQINNSKIDLFDKNIEISKLLFLINKNNYLINDVELSYKGVSFLSNNIRLNKNGKSFEIKGDFRNPKTNVNLKNYSFINKNIFNLLVNRNIEIETKNIFSLNINNQYRINNLSLVSDLKIKDIELKVENEKFKKIFNLAETVNFENNQINIEFSGDPLRKNKKNIISLNGEGTINNKKNIDKILYSLNRKNNNTDVKSQIFLINNSINIDLLKFQKDKGINSLINFDILHKNNNKFILKKLSYSDEKNKLNLRNLIFSEKLKIFSLDSLELEFENTSKLFNRIKLTKGKDYSLNGALFDASNIINHVLKSNKKNIRIFKNLNTKIIVDLDKLYIDNLSFVNKLNGSVNIHNGKIIDLNFKSYFSNKEILSLNLRTTQNNEKVTTLSTKYPKPLINRYKFIKGFEEGIFDFQSIKKDGKSKSLLIIDNFKVKEVPVLAKILTLASLQGIADLLTGEGIRFSDFEMKFSNENNLMTIEEIYAIGPSISILMSGYVEMNKIVSLRGTLVPATTINRTISSIPVLGDILVGKKVGEGVFGVSFKIKGPPKNLKTTVNPIKTLTPRFITRTLEKIRSK